jgi:3-hydroxyisobutyrate dehydrogenase-like beta-hydroxyacid dehydrogenase
MSGGGEEKPKIGFLGMGIMGVPMSRNLIKVCETESARERDRVGGRERDRQRRRQRQRQKQRQKQRQSDSEKKKMMAGRDGDS